MDADSLKDGQSSCELEAESNNVDSLEVILSSGETMQELGSFGDVIAKVELDLACSSERIVNLGVLKMHVETRENDFEAFVVEELSSDDSIQKAMEFNLLSAFLDSEIRELSGFLSTLQIEIDNFRQVIPSIERVGELHMIFEEKLYDSESFLKQSQDQLLELKAQSSHFQRILLACMGNENWEDDYKALESFESVTPITPNTKIKMQTAEHQRHVLQMLEKSLANELDLEKKLSESKQNEEELKHTLEQQLYCLEVEVEDTCERLFGAENASEVLFGVSKELRGELQRTQFNLNSALKREEDLKSKLKDLEELLSAKDSLLQEANSVNAKDSSKIQEMEATINDLMEKNSSAERRAEDAENTSKLLKEANMELNKGLSLHRKSSTLASEKINLLEKKLKESELHLQHAVASAEASQEKQAMLNFTIKDMENLIEDLKSKVSKAESQTESVEDKCIFLSEANAALNEELNFLKGQVQCLEASLHKAEETKKATARDISVHSKFIMDLIMQLALERERLYKQIPSLTKEKKGMKKQFQQKEKVPDSVHCGDEQENTGESMLTKDKSCNANSPKESKEETTELSNNMDKTSEEIFEDEAKTEDTVSTSNLDSSRDIDARQLKLKHFITAALLIMIPALLAVLYQNKIIES